MTVRRPTKDCPFCGGTGSRRDDQTGIPADCFWCERMSRLNSESVVEKPKNPQEDMPWMEIVGYLRELWWVGQHAGNTMLKAEHNRALIQAFRIGYQKAQEEFCE